MVFGSEIMKKLNSRKAPLSSRWSGIVIGSPSDSERPTSSAAQAAMNASVTSLRAARLTTSIPAQAIVKAKAAAVPHCPGDTHARSVVSSSATSAPLVGLKTCLPRTRITNFDPTAMAEATAAIHSASVRSSRHRLSAEMSALFAPERHGAPVQAVAQALHRQRRGHGDRHLRQADVEAEPAQPVGQQDAEGEDLPVPGVGGDQGPEARGLGHRRRPLLLRTARARIPCSRRPGPVRRRQPAVQDLISSIRQARPSRFPRSPSPCRSSSPRCPSAA